MRLNDMPATLVAKYNNSSVWASNGVFKPYEKIGRYLLRVIRCGRRPPPTPLEGSQDFRNPIEILSLSYKYPTNSYKFIALSFMMYPDIIIVIS